MSVLLTRFKLYDIEYQQTFDKHITIYFKLATRSYMLIMGEVRDSLHFLKCPHNSSLCKDCVYCEKFEISCYYITNGELIEIFDDNFIYQIILAIQANELDNLQ